MRATATPWAVNAAMLAAVALLCSACQDYLARRDTLTSGSGDAVHANIATQVIDPWPPYAMRVEPDTSGDRLQHAIERYRNPTSGGQAGGLSPVPVGPSNAPPASIPSIR